MAHAVPVPEPAVPAPPEPEEPPSAALPLAPPLPVIPAVPGLLPPVVGGGGGGLTAGCSDEHAKGKLTTLSRGNRYRESRAMSCFMSGLMPVDRSLRLIEAKTTTYIAKLGSGSQARAVSWPAFER